MPLGESIGLQPLKIAISIVYKKQGNVGNCLFLQPFMLDTNARPKNYM
jgi:hypothetical protein